MSTDLKAVMDRDARRRRMLQDPDLTGDLLLLALALDELNVMKKEGGRKKLRSWVVEAAALVHDIEANPYYRQYWVRNVIKGDLPRYAPDGLRNRGCAAPMIRRDGECGKPGTTKLIDRDPSTGESRWVHFCNRHKASARPVEERVRQWRANGQPCPPANTGGVLRRYFAGNWDEIYHWASGQAPMEGGREATIPRPKLRLIQGGGEPGEPETVPSEYGDQFVLEVQP